MTRDLGTKSYFRITLDELKNLGRNDLVAFTLPEGRVNVPVGVLLDRFSTSKSWANRGEHASSAFPQWLATYRDGLGEDVASVVSMAAQGRQETQGGGNEPVPTRKSGATDAQRQRIRQALFGIVEKLSAELVLAPEAVVLEMRYFHQTATNPYRTNASKADRTRSLRHHQFTCQAQGCDMRLTLDTAVFHHVRRGFTGQHEPENLLPYCEPCHDDEHDLPEGKSLSKGSRS